jgi:hypothetical protein
MDPIREPAFSERRRPVFRNDESDEFDAGCS